MKLPTVVGAFSGFGFGLAMSILLEASCIFGLVAIPGSIASDAIVKLGFTTGRFITMCVFNAIAYGAVGGAIGYWICLSLKRKQREGQCRTCGYNLTGNMSGVCPECGNYIRS